jgi:cytochrome b
MPIMTDHATTDAQAPKTVKVWDVPTRLFHWALVLLVLLSYLTGEFGGFNFVMPVTNDLIANMTVHMWSGFGILTLLLFRVVWGVMGSTTARFTDFVRGPMAILDYLKGVATRAVKFSAGHNPAGGAMVILILLLLLLQASTGLFSKEDDFFGIAGPLNGYVSEDTAKMLVARHKQIWGYIELLVIIHIAANVIYWLVLKQNLILAMFTGEKALPPNAHVPPLKFASNRAAIVVLVATAVIVWRIAELG